MIEDRIKYWKKQIDLFGKQSIYREDIELIEETIKEIKELQSTIPTEEAFEKIFESK